MKRVLLTLLFLVLPVLLVVWQVCFADTTSWYLVAAVLLLLSALPFFLHLERKPISAREMALLSVLTALAVVSRAVFYLIPQVKPIAAVVIVAGMCLGPFSGYMVGALSAFLSNFLFGQGIWTPFQMVALGLVGLLAGMLLRPGRVNRWVLALVGFFLATVVYGLVVDLSTVLMTVTDFTWPAVLAVYASGAPFDLVFGGSTAVLPVVEAGIADGSLQAAEPTAFAEVVALLANLWLSPLVFADGPEKRKQKLAFLCTLCEPTGLDLAPLQPYLDQL